jgi:Zn-dependent protease with chaperone function
VPAVYVLDGSRASTPLPPAIRPDDAAVGVTRGALDLLNRDELQGVMAHEFSHILNGDMRLNIRLIGVLHGILVIWPSSAARCFILRSGGQLSPDAAPRSGRRRHLLIIGLALLRRGLHRSVLRQADQAAVSRQREYLADAAAVQFTRNPEGIAGALKKIGGLSQGPGSTTLGPTN